MKKKKRRMRRNELRQFGVSPCGVGVAKKKKRREEKGKVVVNGVS